MRKKKVSWTKEIKIDALRRWSLQILERINDDANKMDLSGEYGVSATFNISYLFLFDVGDDLSMNPFKERREAMIWFKKYQEIC